MPVSFNPLTGEFDYISQASVAASTIFNADTGSASPTGGTLSISGGEGIDTSASGSNVTIAGEDATTANKGIASFTSADFGVSSGAVSLDEAVVKSVSSDSGSATPVTHSFAIAGSGGISTSGSGATITIDGSGISSGISTLNGDSGSATGSTVTITGGEGIDTSATGSTVTISGEDASTSNKGIASFSSSDFGVSSGAVSLGNDVVKDIGTDSGAVTPSTHTFNIVGGEGIDTSGTTDTVTIQGEDASTSNKGIASFDSSDFGVMSGDVSLSDTVVKTVASDSGSATPSSHGFTIAGSNGITTSGSGSTITVDGSGAGGGAWTFVSNTTISNDATVDFTDLDTSGLTYLFVLQNVIPANDGNELYMRMSTNNGSSYASGSSDYEWSGASHATGDTNSVGSTADSEIQLTHRGMGNATGEKLDGEVTLIDPQSTSGYHLAASRMFYTRASAARPVLDLISGCYNSTTAVDAVQFFASSGNLSSGNILLFTRAVS